MWAAGLILLREGMLILVRALHGSCELEKLGFFIWSVQVEGQAWCIGVNLEHGSTARDKSLLWTLRLEQLVSVLD